MNQRGSQDQGLSDQPRTITRGGGRAWIYPVEISGRWTRLRSLVATVLVVLFFSSPWLLIGGKPLLLLNFSTGSFVIAGQTVLMREFYHFVLLFLLLVTTLFLASTLLGRIWCGYACPQTIFIEQIFLRIERLVEGPALRRRANDMKPWTMSIESLQRATRKILKQCLFVVVSVFFGLTIVAIFVGKDRVFWPHEWSVILPSLLLAGLAWFDGAYWREQFCQIVCPYGRFQGAMQDKATRTVGYDAARGEPRRHGKQREDAGDCIDCGLCVRVCPAGIDIRQGPSQIECIGCARCVDACDGIMTNLGKAPGLIRYDALDVFAAGMEGKVVPPPPWLRPRLIVYGVIWLSLAVVGVSQFWWRSSFHVQALSASSSPFYVAGSVVKNLFTLKIGNQAAESLAFDVTLAPGASAHYRIESPTRSGPIAPGRDAVLPMLVSSTAAQVERTPLCLIVSSIPATEVVEVCRLFVRPSEAASRDD